MVRLMADVLAYLQSFNEAATFAQRTVDAIEKIYHPNNAQLGMMVMRAGVTHWHAGLIDKAHAHVCRALGILMVTHGPLHPITRDLEGLRVQTEMELRLFRENEFAYERLREAALQGSSMRLMAEPQTGDLRHK
nr:histone-lysine N-methyltransferase SMYD1-like [Petromyzon marinus]